MKANIFFKTLLFSFLFISLLSSCRKDNCEDFSPENTYTFGEAISEESQSMADQAVSQGDISYKNGSDESILSCAIVTRDTISNPKTCTIDFGSGCVGNDGRNRKGKILISYTGPYKQAGTVINISHDNFFVDNNQILTTRTIENMGYNDDGKLYWNVDVNGSIVKAAGGSSTWVSEKVRVMEEGEQTTIMSDDVYSVTGNVSGTLANGRTFTAQSIEPLVRKMMNGCRRHFVKGKLEMNVSGKPTRLIDFGNGDCDNQATVTVNGNTFIIQL